MGKAIGASVPLAAGIALSPIPVIAVVLVLASRRARANGAAFIAGWLAGLGVVGVISLAVAGRSAAGKPGNGGSWLNWAEILLAVVLLVIAGWQFRNRRRGDQMMPMPTWIATVDKITPAAALGLAAVLSGVNPKNLVLAVGGAAAIARTGIPGPQQAIAYVIFALIGTLSVGIPVAVYVAMGERSVKLLLRLKDWMTRHGATITIVLCLVIAAKLISDAATALRG